MLIALSIYIAGSLLAASSSSMLMLIAGRIVQGFGGGILSAVAYVIVARGYQAVARPRMLAMLASAWVIPGLIGPAVASVVAAYLGWRWHSSSHSWCATNSPISFPGSRSLPGSSSWVWC